MIINRQLSLRVHLYVAGAVGGHGAACQLACKGTVQEEAVAGEGPGLAAEGHHVPCPIIRVRLQNRALRSGGVRWGGTLPTKVSSMLCPHSRPCSSR